MSYETSVQLELSSLAKMNSIFSFASCTISSSLYVKLIFLLKITITERTLSLFQSRMCWTKQSICFLWGSIQQTWRYWLLRANKTTDHHILLGTCHWEWWFWFSFHKEHFQLTGWIYLQRVDIYTEYGFLHLKY